MILQSNLFGLWENNKTALCVCVWCMYVCFTLLCHMKECQLSHPESKQLRLFTCNMLFASAEIDSVKLARLVFNKLGETCCHWLKEFPYRRRQLPYYETSIHAIKNMRRKMEDKHVVIPDFNTLFNLQVWPWLWPFIFHQSLGVSKKLVFVFSMDAFNWSKVTVQIFIML